MDMPLGIVLGTAVAGVLAWLGFAMARRRRRRRILSAPFPAEWEEAISQNVSFYHRLPEDLRTRLQDLVKLFMAEKDFEGCGGLWLTEGMKVTIAAQACVLVLNRGGLYPRLTTVLVYPRTYVAQGHYSSSEHVVKDSADNIGESWRDGMVVLAWNHVRRGARERDYGQNVTFHEFAHQLDSENGVSDGTPLLADGGYAQWGAVMGREFQALRDKIDRDERDLLDDYAATNPAEFFAVATETFFESPQELRDEHPELYEQLRRCYQLDPAEW